MHEKSDCVVILSGGQDSTTCLLWAKKKFAKVHCVTFDYGQRHKREIDSARNVARFLEADSHEVITFPKGILQGTSPLVSDEELEQYEDPNNMPDGIEKTFVPMRNQLFLTVAANRAYVLGARNLVTGVSQEDYGGYPDCRLKFIMTIEQAMNAGTFTGEPGTLRPCKIWTPLLDLNKAETCKMAFEYTTGVPALAMTHTAYDGQYPPTGKDHATLLRAKGFEEAKLPDPLILRAFLEGHIEELPRSMNYGTHYMRMYMDLVKLAINWMEEHGV